MSVGEDDLICAVLLAAGALPEPQRRAAKRRRGDDSRFDALTMEWETALAPLALALKPVEPPPGLLGDIEALLDARDDFRRIAATLREPAEGWIELAPGLRCLPLPEHSTDSRRVLLMDARPGAVHAGHHHELNEDIYVISGDLILDGEPYGPGAFVRSKPGSSHEDATTRAGCRCLVANWS